MTAPSRPDIVTDLAALEAIYGAFPENGRLKETPVITPLQRRWIEASPFVLIATAGEEGLDCSPRGDPAPAVHIVDERTLHLPDRRGNNRLDTLRNIVSDGRVGLLFLVPGLGTTVRVNGTAVLRTDPELLERYAMARLDGRKLPQTVIEIAVQTVYTQCPKALIRSDLWNSAHHRRADELPTVGAIMAEITDGGFDGVAWDAAYPQRIADTIY
ncbi:MAG: pyridoxamine 5'-phosphate oxidase family protein [Kineosporiaceae bacterium]|nr:pyridoxamine 5'-phosphate oxidase family protein [Kineosporiaceae bacterium]MBL8932003.1 pyridoxamine 5'-phosphate oxidase family protein [Kineosporiaceae bacterium]